ncbi:tol-pal system protein YbgF [Rhodoferax sp.]|uniref:tol-pal system protein YbgF n=1 Tax=Rhodoferax sp. TaxID=50421 RepID=UPI00374DA8FA
MKSLARPTTRPVLRLAAVAMGCWLAMAGAQAGVFDDDEARKAILDLRQRVDSSRQATETANQRLAEDIRRSSEDNAQLRRSLLDLQGQIDNLRGDLAQQRGANEQLARDVTEVQRRLKDQAQGVDERLRKFEPSKVTLDGKDFTADPAESRDFDAALAIFRKGDFASAQTSFTGFVKRYPQSGYNPSALFWLGNAQYATKDYKDAIGNFRALLTAAPDHPRAAEAALSIANCQMELKDSRSARKTLEDLVKAYPQSEAASAAKDRLAKLK